MPQERRLAAILVADVVGYSRLVGADESGTLSRLAALRHDIADPLIAGHGGRTFKETGDGFLVEFASAVQAVACARALQEKLDGGPLTLRIGIHVGDVVVQGNDLMGDGVNIAARLESVAEPGGIALSRQVHDQVRDRIDAVFEDRGEVELKNIARPVHVFALMGRTIEAAPASAPALALPDKPSIAVLPFQNMSGDPEQEYFADGMAEDIITALSRFKSLFVIARNSSFAYKGKSPDIRQVGRELGVRYVLEGSVRKGGTRLRITGQLIDSQSGAHLWAERFDGGLEDVFDLQDQVTARAVAAIAPRLEQAEWERARRKPAENLDAYDCFLRSCAAVHEGSRSSFEEALRLSYRAIELEPDFATPYGIAARCYTERKNAAWVEDIARESTETTRLAMMVQRIGRDDGLALAYAGRAVAFVCHEYDIASALVEQAVVVNLNLAQAWLCLGTVNLYSGNYQIGIEQLHQVLRMSPMDPESYRFQAFLGWGYLFQGRLEDAIKWSGKARAHRPDAPAALRVSAAANALAGNMDEARSAMENLLGFYPEATLSYHRFIGRVYRRRDDFERVLEGLRLAGMPE